MCEWTNSLEELGENAREAGQRYVDRTPTCGDQCQIDQDPEVNRVEARVFAGMILGDERVGRFPWLGTMVGLQGMGVQPPTARAVLGCVERHRCGDCAVEFSDSDEG